MYGKFCNNYNSEELKIAKRKKSVREVSPVKLDNLSMGHIVHLKEKMSSFSIEKSDP